MSRRTDVFIWFYKVLIVDLWENGPGGYRKRKWKNELGGSGSWGS